MASHQVKSDPKRVESIIVVGGGSSGWMTACLINSRLNEGGHNPVKITLIEAPDIPVIGVGEATVPSIRRTLQAIGISEKDFMKGADATFKSLIRFEGWNKDEHFDHPFDRRERPQSDPALLSWLAKNEVGGEAFSNQFSILSNTSTNLLAPKALGWPDYQSTFPYAYHLDAVKLGQVLTEFGINHGIDHKLTKIEAVNLNEAGEITSLVSEEGDEFSADLYIDCTGFSARLASKVMSETQEYSDTLLCDRAVTMSVPYEVFRPDHILPYTSAKACDAGWLWDINLRSRRSLGYVHSSAHISADEAEAELQKMEGPHADAVEAKHIRFKTYKRKQSWSQNCIAIGLADGFVEPLESTGLYMMQFAAQSVADILRFGHRYTPETTHQFNRLMQNLFDEILGYVALHYLTSKRRDTQFWIDATRDERIPHHLKYLLSEWKRRPPHDMDLLQTHRLFSLESYEYLLIGMGFMTDGDINAKHTAFDNSDALRKCYAKLPLHEDWLNQAIG